MTRLNAQTRGRERTDDGRAAEMTTDHEFTRRWADDRGARPARVKRAVRTGDAGSIHLDFPGSTAGNAMEEIDGDDRLEEFEEKELALVYRDDADHRKSRVHNPVSRDSEGGSEAVGKDDEDEADDDDEDDEDEGDGDEDDDEEDNDEEDDEGEDEDDDEVDGEDEDEDEDGEDEDEGDDDSGRPKGSSRFGAGRPSRPRTGRSCWSRSPGRGRRRRDYSRRV